MKVPNYGTIRAHPELLAAVTLTAASPTASM